MAKPKTIATSEALLLTADECADLVRVNRSTFLRWVARGATPRPVKIGGSTRWSREAMERWVALGCPSRSDFEILTRQ